LNKQQLIESMERELKHTTSKKLKKHLQDRLRQIRPIKGRKFK